MMFSALSSPVLFSVVLCLASAIFYVAGTAAMKIFGHLPFALLMIPVGLTFLVAAWFEVAVLRHARLGQAFLLIFAFEVTLTAVLALFFLNERYSMREVFGLATIIVGIGLLVSGSEDHVPMSIPIDVIGMDATHVQGPLPLGPADVAHKESSSHLERGNVRAVAASELEPFTDVSEPFGNPDGPALQE